jgi:hypothetical protein
MAAGTIFEVVAPTRALLVTDRTSRPTVVQLPAGTNLRHLRSDQLFDPCSDVYMFWDEFVALDGSWAGRRIDIADARTPDHGLIFGWRPELGPPASLRLMPSTTVTQ